MINELRSLIKDMQAFKILIVDDKANMRRTLRNMLRQIGFTNFREAEDGDVAVSKIRAENFDFVLCDWNMPRMNGVEVLRNVREEERFRDLPFLMVTAEVEEGTVAEVIEADVDGYILKPFVPKTLEDKIVEILRKKAMPSPLETHLRVAEVHLKARNYSQVHKELDEATKISPRSPKVFYARGITYEAEGDLKKAEQSYLQARQMGPKFIKAHEKLAEIYEKQGRTSEMLAVVKEAVNVSPKNSDRQTKLGEALLAEGRIQEAKKAFAAATDLDPNNPSRLTAIGEAFLAQGLSQEAEKAFSASIKNDPQNIFVYNRLGIAYRRQKKFDEAIKLYQKALTIDPEEVNIFFNLSRAYLGVGDKSQAATTLRRALRIDPNFTEAKELLAKIEGS